MGYKHTDKHDMVRIQARSTRHSVYIIAQPADLRVLLSAPERERGYKPMVPAQKTVFQKEKCGCAADRHGVILTDTRRLKTQWYGGRSVSAWT
jgi:hypothetical protein